MEKWAKSLNAQKEAYKEGFKRPTPAQLKLEKESASADAGFAVLEMAKTDRQGPLFSRKEDNKLMPPPPLVSVNNSLK